MTEVSSTSTGKTAVQKPRPASGCLMAWGFAFSLGLAFFFIACAGLLGFILGRGNPLMDHGPGVAVLDVRDELLDERRILEDLESLTDDPDTKALVVRVDSPGGVITVVEEIYKDLQRTAEDGIPVIASMGSTAASGGYYVCLAAQRIYANNSSLTGSIGVLTEYTSASELFQKIGVRLETIKTGEFKGIGSLNEPLTDRQREHLQTVMTDFHEQFMKTVQEERKLSPEKVRELSDGRMFTGRQALELGLVDAVGDLKDAIHCAAEAAGLDTPPRVIRVSEKHIPFWTFLDRLGADPASAFMRRGFVPKYLMR
ncbi:MAG: signal peptide peptidase SppA [Candidatus Hydrogenedentes bacterium]|nr:signal peptide peptidase SppA [Candidatus Hydrogenedentota bacterium]